MKLSDLKFKTNYNSYDDDLIDDFYIKSLSCAKNYDRVSAFFDSEILSLYASGTEKIYENNGKIRFIFSQELSEKDFEEMQKGYSNRPNDILLEKMRKSVLTDEEKTRLSNLSFLIERGIVDVKIAFTKSGILHDKFGLIYDEMNNYLFFRGSNNETVAAIKKNHERFEVSCSWYNEELENKKIKEAKDSFEKMWNDALYGVKVVNIPDIIVKEIAKYSNGKFILEEDISYKNALIADLDTNNHMIIRNNLDYNYNFDDDWDYRNYIKDYVTLYDNKIFYFKEDINYVIMNKIIDRFTTSATYNSYSFRVTKKLRDYIKGKNIQIEKRIELGKLIKKRDSLVLGEFNKFKAIVDEQMERKLTEKQMWDSFFIKEMKRSANYSVPGSGKTSIAYGAFSYLNSDTINKVDKIVMIGPKNSFKSWKDEFKKCFGEKKKLNLINIQDSKYRNTNEKIQALLLDSRNANLILVNYDMLPALADTLNEIIDDRTFLVYDEVHKVKAIGGVWASAALKVCKNANYKVVLTGTPMPNSYVDLYNQLNILFTDEYKSFFRFTTSELKNADDTMALRINEKIRPFFCRTTKKQLNIPEPNPDEKIVSYMNDKESKLFSLLRRKYNHNGLELYIRLLQASTNPKLLHNSIDIYDIGDIFSSEETEDNLILGYDLSNIHFERETESNILNLIDEIDMTSKFWNGISLIEKLVQEKKQVVVWAIFVDTIQRIKTELDNRNIKAEIIYGATPLEDRENLIEKFKNQEYNVLITNPHTLAESVSLHETCHDAIYFEYSFNLTHMLQSRDRINRLGLKEDQYTQYYYLFLCNKNPEDDSIDLRTYDRLEEKKNIMIKSVEGELLENINFDIIDDLKKILGED